MTEKKDPLDAAAQEEADAALAADLFRGNMTTQEKLEKLGQILSTLQNAGYADSMAWELSTKSPTEQALQWEQNGNRRAALDRIYARLRSEVEYFEGQTDETGAAHGQGTFYFQDGSRYEGGFVHGEREGFGIQYAADGRKYYEGEWKQGKMLGHGVMTTWKNERFESDFCGTKQQGAGTKTFVDGRILAVTWDAFGCIAEIGACQYPNGDTYTGGWMRLDYPHGKGVYAFPDGSNLQGCWNTGKKEGMFVYTSPEGVQSNRLYQQDVWVQEPVAEPTKATFPAEK